MDFTLICPRDGRVELGLEDITTVVFSEPEQVDVVFVCPHCGSPLRATLRVPNLLVAALELARHAEEASEGAVIEIRRVCDGGDLGADRDGRAAEMEARLQRERDGEPYCEYFRRQLARVECVEDLLAELEQR